MKMCKIAVFGVLVGLLGLPAQAAITQFQGQDSGVPAGGARPSSDTARNNFFAAIDSVSTITFETAPLGTFTSISVAPGVVLATTNNTAGIVTGDDTILGYNTTSGGARFAQMSPTTNPATFDFSFAVTPIDAFGAYITGLGTSTGSVAVQFNDGSSRSLPVVGNVAGGVQYFAFSDPGTLITAVHLVMTGGTGDVWSMDDVSYSPSVPEPSTMMLLLGGCAGSIGMVRRNRK